jgi:endonuclease/exonuclease/phosphatase family metal-dependent hydrolase
VRIVTWNCNGAFRRKLSEVDLLGADVLAIQECEDPQRSKDAAYRSWAGNRFVWTGTLPSRGLGLFSRSITPEPLPEENGNLFLAALVGSVPVCAVWTQKDTSGVLHYVGQLWKLIGSMPGWLTDPLCVLAGDFNSNRVWDRPRRPWNHSSVVASLDRLGMFSAYHAHFDEQHGSESRPTFFLHRDLARPSHIDYVFVGQGWEVVSVGVPEPLPWLSISDHIPIIVDLRLRRAIGST